MSASREKKARQGLGADYVSPQQEKERKEKASSQRTTIIFTVLVALFVLFAAAMLLWNSNIIQRKAVALRVNDQTYTAADLAYYYYSNRTTELNKGYASLDSSKSLREQTYLDEAQTWYDYVLAEAVEELSQVAVTSQAAKDAGFDDQGQVEQSVSDTMDYITSAASQNGYTVSQYLKAVYGPLMTRSVFERNLRMSALASAYASSISSIDSFSDAELQAVYEADPNACSLARYESILFSSGNYMTDDETAAEGETSDATTTEGESGTDDESVKTAAANAAAAEDAAAALARVNAGESFEDVADDMGASYTSSSLYYSADETVSEWLFDDARKDGEVTVLDYYGSGSLVIRFLGKERADFHTVDVRHILVADEETAQSLLDQFNAGDKSEASFAQLATENTTDQGSAENGGLYTNVYVGQMVQPFEDWCFDASRKAGDTGIVETQFGYHVMYYVGQSDYAYWQAIAASTLAQDKTDELLSGISTERYEKGLKYIDPIR